MNLNLFMIAALFVGASATAQTLPTLPWPRTLDLIVGERTNEKLLRLRDLDQDGDYQDPGETTTFFTNGPGNVSGITLVSTTGIACGVDGTVFAVTSSSDEIVALRDLNGDGDADDAGEAVVWFSSAANASGVQLGSAQSLTVDQFGRVFMLTANVGSTVAVGIDGVVQIEDSDRNGNAQDAGEATYYLRIPGAAGAIGHSNPTEFAFGPDGSLYFADIGTNGPIARGIYKATDLDLDGDCNDAGEVTLWWVPPFTGVPSWYGMAMDTAGQLYLANHGSSGRSIYRASDASGDGVVDSNEQTLCHGGATSGIWWDLARRDDGALMMIDSTPDAILALRDLNGDGAFTDVGEVTTVWDKVTTGFTADLRTLTFLRGPLLDMAPSAVSLGNPTSWSMRTAEPFDLAIALAANTIVPPISLPPWGHLEIDPSTLILFGLGVSDAACQASFTLTVGIDPALLGTYACQAWCGELSRMYFSNPASLVVTP